MNGAKPIINKKYIKWIKEQPCVVTHRIACDPHHIKRPGFGQGMKCDDIFAIPLDREIHTEFHAVGWKTWEDKYNIDQYEECCKLIQKYNREIGL